MNERELRIGVIADTHSLLRPWAIAQLAGSDAIIHAGDIGKPEVIEALADIAPLTVVRGNIDKWAVDLPDIEVAQFGERYVYVLHDLKELDLDPAAGGFDVVISGHSHQPAITRHDGVLYLNPGSAGPRRFTLPIALAELTIGPGGCAASIIEMPPE